MPLSPLDVRRRLAFIRYLHHLGADQARLPEPLSSASILMLHDAAEAFLLLAAEHLGATPPNQFDKYWDELSPNRLPGGVQLPMRQGMRRLNRIRVTLKHHGGHPGQPTIDQAAAETGTFLEEGTRVVFGLDYATVSMAEVIPQQPVRDLVHQAETASTGGDRLTAMIALADAWGRLFGPLDDESDDTSLMQVGPPLGRTLSRSVIEQALAPPTSDRFRAFSGQAALAEQIATVTEVVRELKSVTKMTALGLDFATYQRFRLLTPRVDHPFGDRLVEVLEGYAPTPEDVAWCCQFIVTVALRLAAVEAHLALPPWRTGPDWTEAWVMIGRRGEAE